MSSWPHPLSAVPPHCEALPDPGEVPICLGAVVLWGSAGHWGHKGGMGSWTWPLLTDK